jgi:hypothetical protein
LVKQIVDGLKARGKTVPGYIELMALNNSTKPTPYETAVFGMT